MSVVLHLSDLHLDINERSLERGLVNELISFLKSKSYDLLLISGDIGNDSDFVLWVLNKIKFETNREVLFVPGNHDIWTDSQSKNSLEILNEYIDHGSNLIGSPYLVGDWAIVGGFSWYDYSYRPLNSSVDDSNYMKKKLWADSKYAKFNLKDPELCELMMARLKSDLDSVKDKKVLLMNHFVPNPDFIVTKTDWNWNMCNSYLGTIELKYLIEENPNIELVTFGHTHHRFNRELDGIQYVCNPLGYQVSGEWETNDFINELSLVCFEYELN